MMSLGGNTRIFQEQVSLARDLKERQQEREGNLLCNACPLTSVDLFRDVQKSGVCKQIFLKRSEIPDHPNFNIVFDKQQVFRTGWLTKTLLTHS